MRKCAVARNVNISCATFHAEERTNRRKAMSFRFAPAIVGLLFLLHAAPAISGPASAPGAVLGDLNGDGETDIVYKDVAGGGVDIWTLTNGAFVRRSGFMGGTAFKLKTIGKFDADNNADLVIYNPTTGQVGIWFMQQVGTNIQIKNFKVVIPNAGPNAPAGTGDWNQDGNLDLLLFDPATRNLSIALLDANNVLIAVRFVGKVGGIADPTGALLVPGNFDNDTVPDIALSLQNGTQVGFWKMGGADGTTIQRGAGFNLATGVTLIPSVADMDGNGTDDFMSFTAGTGVDRAFFVSSTPGFLGVLSGNQFTGTSLATQPFAFGQFTSGGTDTNPDLLLQDPTNRNVATWQLMTGALLSTTFVGTPAAAFKIALLGE